jgi:chaperonin GroEL (HSP60 family)
LEEAVLRNIQAVGELTEIVRTSFGPNGSYLHLKFTEDDS